jgi:hypothetical protein
MHLMLKAPTKMRMQRISWMPIALYQLMQNCQSAQGIFMCCEKSMNMGLKDAKQPRIPIMQKEAE